MTEQQPNDPRQGDQQNVRQAHEQQEASQARRDRRNTSWGKILMPLTVIAFLAVFIAAMLIIYNIAQ
ncbi:MAG TPA: hypothetical protein VK925_04695 [Jiangellaceae bacterium]|nr:hypothetical protein [Jiangellaceae bacterium]